MSRRSFSLLYTGGFKVPARLRSNLCLRVHLRSCGTPATSEELQKIVSETDQIPLGGYLANPAQQELPEFAHMFDLAEDGLHNPFALPIETLPLHRLEL